MGGMVAGRDRETGHKDCQSVVVAHEFLKSMSRPDRATKHDHLDTACKYDTAVDEAPGLIEGIHRKAGRYEPECLRPQV